MMAVRDTGWIQIVVENGQEVVDNILCAFKIAEDKNVLLPVMIHLDGFHLSHVIEPVVMPEKTEVDAFLKHSKYPLPLHPSRPVAMGDFGPPVIYTEAKWAQEVNLRNSKKTILEVWSEFKKLFDRDYKPVETYKTEGAATLLLTMGSYSETAMTAIDSLQEKGERVGLVRLRLWRPFPFKELRETLKGIDTLIILDRALSYGGPGGPVASEIKAALYSEIEKPKIVSIIAGLGGRDINVNGFIELIHHGVEVAQRGSEFEYEFWGVRG
jgi:pyruvate ferredoxin oxidoreductase alpha subunit